MPTARCGRIIDHGTRRASGIERADVRISVNVSTGIGAT